jgi:hypothetical protein
LTGLAVAGREFRQLVGEDGNYVAGFDGLDQARDPGPQPGQHCRNAIVSVNHEGHVPIDQGFGERDNVAVGKLEAG